MLAARSLSITTKIRMLLYIFRRLPCQRFQGILRLTYLRKGNRTTVMTETTETIREPIAPAPAAAPMNEGSLRKRVFGLAAPVIGENFLETLLGIIDTVLVGGLGAAAIAGVGSALQVMFFLISALTALAIGSSVLVAQAFGAGDLERAGRLARQSLIWSVVCSIPLAVGGWFLSAPLIGIFGLSPDVAQIGTEYLQVTMGTIVVLIALFIGGGVLRGAGDSRTPMVVTGIANVINVGLAYGMIYGHFGLPALGPVGSAWATFIARAIALVLLIWALWQGRNGVTIRGGDSWRPNTGAAGQILRIGIPAAMEQVLVSSAFFFQTIFIASLGTLTLAAYRIEFTALTFSFLPGIGFAIAATALVGQSVGAKRLDEGAQATRIATLWGTVWMGALGVAFFLFAEPIMRLFSAEPQVIAVGAAGLRAVALAQPFWAIMFVQAGALRGVGNTRFPLLVTGGGMWLSVVLAFVLVKFVSGSLVMVWAAFLIVSPLMAALMWWRFRQTARQA